MATRDSVAYLTSRRLDALLPRSSSWGASDMVRTPHDLTDRMVGQLRIWDVRHRRGPGPSFQAHATPARSFRRASTSPGGTATSPSTGRCDLRGAVGCGPSARARRCRSGPRAQGCRPSRWPRRSPRGRGRRSTRRTRPNRRTGTPPRPVPSAAPAGCAEAGFGAGRRDQGAGVLLRVEDAHVPLVAQQPDRADLVGRCASARAPGCRGPVSASAGCSAAGGDRAAADSMAATWPPAGTAAD